MTNSDIQQTIIALLNANSCPKCSVNIVRIRVEFVSFGSQSDLETYI